MPPKEKAEAVEREKKGLSGFVPAEFAGGQCYVYDVDLGIVVDVACGIPSLVGWIGAEGAADHGNIRNINPTIPIDVAGMGTATVDERIMVHVVHVDGVGRVANGVVIRVCTDVVAPVVASRRIPIIPDCSERVGNQRLGCVVDKAVVVDLAVVR